MSVPIIPLGDRVLIQADIEDRAPAPTESGLVLAKTLTAAVTGEDVEDSWCVGTIVACGPLVNRFDVRKHVARALREALAETNGHLRTRVVHLASGLDHLPTECTDPLQVGDRVTFSWASGQQITVDGERFLIMSAREVLAVVTEE